MREKNRDRRTENIKEEEEEENNEEGGEDGGKLKPAVVFWIRN